MTATDRVPEFKPLSWEAAAKLRKKRLDDARSHPGSNKDLLEQTRILRDVMILTYCRTSRTLRERGGPSMDTSMRLKRRKNLPGATSAPMTIGEHVIGVIRIVARSILSSCLTIRVS